MANQFTTKEVLNKVLLDSSGDAITANSVTSQEALNAVLDTSNNRLNVSLGGSNTISGDVTITGDLTVQGNGTGNYDEIIEGNLVLTSGSKLGVGIGDATPSAPVHVSIAAQDGVSSPIETLRLEVSESFGNIDVGSNQGPAIDFYVPVDSSTSQIGGRIAVGHENGTDTDSSAKLTFTTAPDGASLNAIPAMTINSSNNISLGAESPYTNQSGYHSVRLGGNNVIISKSASAAGQFLSLANNANRDASGNMVAIVTDEASQIAQQSGKIDFYVAGSTTAGATISFTQAMHIANDGKIQIGGGENPSDFDSEANNLVVGNGSGDNGITIFTGSSAGDHGSIFFGDATGTPKQGQIRYEQNNEVMSFFTNTTERMRIDLNGNVGIGVTPETSHSSVTSLQIGGLANVMATAAQSAGGSTWLGNNVYIDSSGGNAYIVTDEASLYRQVGGAHNFLTVASGSADASISWTTNLVLDVNSRISLGNNDSSGATSNTIFGRLAGNAVASGAIDNVLIGNEAGNDITTGDYNIAIGANALEKETVGRSSIAIGAASLALQLTGSEGATNNIGIGINAGVYNETGTNNTLIGTNVAVGASGESHSYNTAVGSSALNSVTSGGTNVAMGYFGLEGVTSGTQNVGVGTQAGQAITTSSGNVVMGFQAMFTPTTLSNCVAIGTESMYSVQAGQAITGVTAVGYRSFKGHSSNTTTGANYSTAIGHQALHDLTTGGSNTAVGALCAENITTGAENTVVGTSAMRNSTTGSNNTAIGRQAMGSGITTGDNNTSVGHNSGLAITSGTQNVLVGNGSGQSLESGDNNVILGYLAGDGFTANNAMTLVGALAGGAVNSNGANGSTAVGYNALGSLVSGADNTALGLNAGDLLTTGAENTLLGESADTSANNSSNQTVVGYGATGQADNSVTLGNASVTAVYMAQDSGAVVHASGLKFDNDQTNNIDEANTLDDYEEGEYNPTLTGSSSGSLGMNSSFDTLSYTKIGRQCTVTGMLYITSDSSLNGELNISLPFAVAGTTETSDNSVGACGFAGIGSAINGTPVVRCAGGTQYADIMVTPNDGGNTFQLTHDYLDSNFYLFITASFITA